VADRTRKRHPAIRHGAYSRKGVLPGESLRDFKKLTDELVEKYQPSGPLEYDVVMTMAQVLWRKQNLGTLKVANKMTWRHNQILYDECQRRNIDVGYLEAYNSKDEEAAAREEAEQVAEAKTRKRFGEKYGLVDVTLEDIFESIAVEERLDAILDKCIKRLLMLKGVNSMIVAPPSRPAKLREVHASDRSAI
jgi:hypothetical protein